MSWAKEKWEDFEVGVAGIGDAIFDTHMAATVDANIAADEYKEATGQEADPEEYNQRIQENIATEDSGAIDKAWSVTEEQVKDSAKSALMWGGSILTIAIVLGAAIGIVYLVKTSGA